MLRFAIAAWLSGACLVAVACTQAATHQIPLGDEIEVGPYALKVLRARFAPSPAPPISTFRQQPGKKAIVVFVEWKRLDDDMDVPQRLRVIERFLTRQLAIADANGNRAEPAGAMQARLMYMQDPGANWRDWIVVFHVPDASRDWHLLVENPEPRDGQVGLVSLPLGI